MSDLLGLPPELQHLIEKRELEDRRQAERRSAGNQAPATEQSATRAEAAGDSAPAAVPPAPDGPAVPETDRRTGADCRQSVRRATDRAQPEKPDRSAQTGSGKRGC